MSTSVATLAEQSAAKLFLRLIGAPTNLPSLTSAVIAWMRVVGSSWNATTYARRLLAGAVYTPTAYDHQFDLIAAKEAAAALYKLVLAAARNGRGGDFLVALIESDFSSTHYGPLTNKNKLLVAYSKITGLAQPQPKAYVAPPVRQPVRPKYLQPPSRTHRNATAFDTQAFYGARHADGGIPGLVTD